MATNAYRVHKPASGVGLLASTADVQRLMSPEDTLSDTRGSKTNSLMGTRRCRC